MAEPMAEWEAGGMMCHSDRVMLDREGNVAGQYPGSEAEVLWLQLQQGVLVSQQQYDSAAELRAALEQVQAQ